MGWLDFLFRPPGRDKFAELVLAEVRKITSTAELSYNPDKFIIERGKDGFINLANLYHEYCAADRKQRGQVLAKYVRSFVGTTSFELPEDFGDVHPDLLPAVRSRFYLESVVLQSKVRGGEGVLLPHQVIGDHLSLSLVYDLPQAMRSIGQEDLDRWNVSFYEAAEAARHNLEQMGDVAFASLQSDREASVYVSATGDNYDASRLVMLDLVRKLPVRGDYIAMVPNRDTLIVTGSDDDAGLEVMAKVAADALEKPRPISTVALRLVEDTWESWLPDPSSPMYDKLHELRMLKAGMEYNDQKQLLDQIHEAASENLFIASFSGLRSKETGRLTSFSVWSEGVPTLLPETDTVVLLQAGPRSEHVEVAAAGDWRRVLDVAGDLMQPMGIYPERYRVVDFPNVDQLAAIGKLDWPAP